MTAFELKPGFVYKTRCGGSVTIARLLEDTVDRYYASDNMGFYYLPDGRIYDDIESPNDIVGVDESALVFVNPRSIAPIGKYTPSKTFSLTVEAVLDGVAGVWDNPADLMRYIGDHSYVRRVILDSEDRSGCTVTLSDLENDLAANEE